MGKIESVKNEIIHYDAPLVEIIEVEVEKGFATSGIGGGGEGVDEEIV